MRIIITFEVDLPDTGETVKILALKDLARVIARSMKRRKVELVPGAMKWRAK